jgi:hypothetical protein
MGLKFRRVSVNIAQIRKFNESGGVPRGGNIPYLDWRMLGLFPGRCGRQHTLPVDQRPKFLGDLHV